MSIILPELELFPNTDYFHNSHPKIISNFVALSAAATEVSAGFTEIATMDETLSGLDDERFVTPLKLSAYVAANAVAQGAAGGDLSGYYPDPSVIAVNTPTDRLTIDDIPDGQFLIRNGSNIEGTASTVAAHELSSSTAHQDVAVSDLQIGQSLVWDGCDWVNTNPAGYFGLDLEYVALDGAEEYGGNLEGYCYAGSSYVVETGSFITPNEYVGRAGNYELSVDFTYSLSGFTGTGYNHSKARGVFIECTMISNSASTYRRHRITAKFPDGTWQNIMRNGPPSSYTLNNRLREIRYVPINEGQTELEISLLVNSSINTTKSEIDSMISLGGAEACKFEIVGIQQTKLNQIAPDLEYINLTGVSSGSGLSQNSAATYTYDLSAFVGDGYDAAKVRSVYVECYDKDYVGTGSQSYVYADLPDGTSVQLYKVWGWAGGGPTVRAATFSPIPIIEGQTQLELRISGTNASYNIVGVQQISSSSYVDFGYLPIDGTAGTPGLSALVDGTTETVTYTLSDWTSSFAGFDSSRIREVHAFVRYLVAGTGGSGGVYFSAQYPYESVYRALVQAERDTDSDVNLGTAVVIPVNNGQTTLELEVKDTTTVTAWIEYTIRGVTLRE